MVDELIICEKPAAAKKVAEALADKSAKKISVNTVPYYEITRNGKSIVVAAAVGHLFGLRDKEKGYTYPVFDIEWAPSHEVRKGSAFTKKYATVLKKLAKSAKTFTVATDYDVEGEVIGLNVVRYLCKQKDARRMKFSTLTKRDLVKAYDAAKPHLDWGQAEAGETRHFLDFYYGINVSRALTMAIKSAGTFKILSSGRVQGPSLKILVDRDREIKEFKPVPFWQVEFKGKAETAPVEGLHKTEKFFEKADADKVMKNVEGAKEAQVAETKKRAFKQAPPTPFDLTTLQTESYRNFGITPKQTLALAQELYTAGYISYPRTSSQKLPDTIDYRKILGALKTNPEYVKLASDLLAKKTLKPNEGKKSDPAHPAIYPTDHLPPKLDGREKKVYDLIVKRFFATFSEPAQRETLTVTLDVNTEPFIIKGTRTTEKGWHVFYAPYVKLEEVELPKMEKGNSVGVTSIKQLAKETQPPKRYTEASIIRELEKRGLGTKATRASIIETLKDRNYIKGRKALEATELGYKTLEILEKYTPRIVDQELTKTFEERMESIREGKMHQAEILKHAKEVLEHILADFKAKEKTVGEDLKRTFADTRHNLQTIGPCSKCEGTLVMKRGKFGKFVACDNYPDCTATFKIPASGLIESAKRQCEECNHPMIRIIRKGKRPTEVCINPECPTKQVENAHTEEHPCPICKEGKMILRKSVYGQFMGCDRYPKCKTIQKINADGTLAPAVNYATKKKKTAKKKSTKKKTTKKKTTKKKTAKKKTTKKKSAKK